MKTIKINCTATHFVPLEKLVSIQGNLKELSTKNFGKLKKQILTHGFTSPIHVFHENQAATRHGDCDELWLFYDERPLKVLDGTQRLRVLTQLKTEGYEIPAIPVTLIDAPDEKTAKQILLGLASQFGEVRHETLDEFIALNEIPMDFVLENYSFPGLFELNVAPLDEEKQEEKSSDKKPECSCSCCEH